MPRYFFHARTAGDYVPDARGIEMSNIEEAKEEALRAVREVIGEAVSHSEAPPTFEIANEAGEILATVSPEEVLSSNPGLSAEFLKRIGFLTPKR